MLVKISILGTINNQNIGSLHINSRHIGCQDIDTQIPILLKISMFKILIAEILIMIMSKVEIFIVKISTVDIKGDN